MKVMYELKLGLRLGEPLLTIPALDLQSTEDISIQAVGRKSTLAFDWQAQLVLPPGQRCPKSQSRTITACFMLLCTA
jgi:hypothetical protein